MTDLISRKAAIEAMEQRYCDIERVKKRPVTKGEQAIFLDMRGVVRSLPSWRCRMSDLISRQDAIDAVDRVDEAHMRLKGYPMIGWCALLDEIESIPSAEPKTGEWIPVSDIRKLEDVVYMHIDSLEGTRNIVEAGMLSAWKEVAEYLDGMLGEDGEE